FLELAHYVGDGGRLLPDGDIDAEEVLALLVDDRIDRNRGLAGLAVADDELALAASDRHHRIDRLQTGLHRLRHRLSRNHHWGALLDDVRHVGIDRTFAIDRLPQGVDHPPEQLRPDGNGKNAAGALGRVPLGDVLVFTQNHRPDRVALEVEGETKR